MPKIQIILDAHLEYGSDNVLLDYRDALKFIDETEVELLLYIKAWCEWLNNDITRKYISSSRHGRYIDDYNHANNVIVETIGDKYILTLEKHVITIYKPFSL